MSKNKDYTEALKKLESTIEEVENGDLTIDELTKKVKLAAELVKICRDQLRTTEEILNKTLEDIN